jgi:hypothetical protein
MGSFAVMALRTQGPPAEIAPEVRSAVALLDPELPLSMELSMAAVLLGMTWFYQKLAFLILQQSHSGVSYFRVA